MQSVHFRKYLFYLFVLPPSLAVITIILTNINRLGVLQSDAVEFEPIFPEWKREALLSFHMTTYTKIFLKFKYKFWGDWQVKSVCYTQYHVAFFFFLI